MSKRILAGREYFEVLGRRDFARFGIAWRRPQLRRIAPWAEEAYRRGFIDQRNERVRS